MKLLKLPYMYYLYLQSPERERNKVYRKMLKLANNSIFYCLCQMLRHSTNDVHEIIDNYKELIGQKPISSIYGAYWWNPIDKTPRINALNKAIELTNFKSFKDKCYER